MAQSRTSGGNPNSSFGYYLENSSFNRASSKLPLEHLRNPALVHSVSIQNSDFEHVKERKSRIHRFRQTIQDRYNRIALYLSGLLL